MTPPPLRIPPQAPATFATPSLHERRDEPSARAAFFAYASAFVPATPHNKMSCNACGQPGPGNWCNICELAHPNSGMFPPLCNTCVADDVECPICGTRPSQGPREDSMPEVINPIFDL